MAASDETEPLTKTPEEVGPLEYFAQSGRDLTLECRVFANPVEYLDSQITGVSKFIVSILHVAELCIDKLSPDQLTELKELNTAYERLRMDYRAFLLTIKTKMDSNHEAFLNGASLPESLSAYLDGTEIGNLIAISGKLTIDASNLGITLRGLSKTLKNSTGGLIGKSMIALGGGLLIAGVSLFFPPSIALTAPIALTGSGAAVLVTGAVVFQGATMNVDALLTLAQQVHTLYKCDSDHINKQVILVQKFCHVSVTRENYEYLYKQLSRICDTDLPLLDAGSVLRQL